MRLAVALLLTLGCGAKEPTEADAAARAEAALSPFTKSLKEALLAELSKSTVAAVDFRGVFWAELDPVSP